MKPDKRMVMKSLLNFKTIIKCLPFIGAALLFTGCQPDKLEDTTVPDTVLQSTFTVSPVQGRTNRYLVTNTTTGAIASRWDIDNGSGWAMGKMADTVFYPDAGTYTIKMQSLNKSGRLFDATPQTVTVATGDPFSGNLVQGGKMNPGDDAYWTKLKIANNNNVVWTFADGKYTVTGTGGGHAGIYQAIQVEANKKYRFAMFVSGSGATDTWFEVYFGTTAPTQGSDYSAGGTQIGLNTWTGCGKTAFSGNLATIGCAGSLKGKNGEITFAQSGTIYLVIKCGTNTSLGTTGISIDNVELRGY